ncbi:MAG: SGNH/GDSL hydrolase family protein [Muribaculaceae bacterium]|nr:SGNH/GDSL hydrolase family protein [Muribaculaceae bacterium]
MKRSYISLWLLLLVAFGLVAAASCLDEVKVGSHSFKTASFYDELSRRDVFTIVDTVPAPADTQSADTVPPAPKFPVPVDTTSKTILFFGDSMLEGLSPRLAAYCEENGHKLYTVIWYSSTTQVWGDCDTLSTFIRSYRPDYVVACLGANELFVRDIAKKREKPMQHILDQIGDRPLLWIGPPNWKDDTGINDFLADKLDEGVFFLSNGMSFDRKKDGAHPTSASAALWMDSVVRWMPDHALYPIRLDMPSKPKGRPARVTLLQPLQ